MNALLEEMNLPTKRQKTSNSTNAFSPSVLLPQQPQQPQQQQQQTAQSLGISFIE
jgi:hypothetical protein